jgi:transposase
MFFFEQAIFQGEVGNDLLQGDGLTTKILDLTRRCSSRSVTGQSALAGLKELVAGGLPVVVVNPAQVRSFAQALGKRAKTDPIDAMVIAHFAEATKPQMRALPDAMTQLLAGLVARRRQIVEMIGAENQRMLRMSHPQLIKYRSAQQGLREGVVRTG